MVRPTAGKYVISDRMSTLEETLTNQGREAKRIIRPLLLFIALLWILEVIDRFFLGGSLDLLGILPRQFVGLRGILFAPFLHGSFSHLLANSIPFLLLSFLIIYRHGHHFLAVSVLIAAFSGFGTWLVAPPNTVHIGASGLIFGYFAFLVVNAWYERSLAAISLAVVVIVVYGSLIWGVLPSTNGISWQGHFFGLVGGGLAAYYFSPRRI